MDHTNGEGAPLIILYKFGPGFDLRETGPFVLKVMAYMRLTGIDFTETVQGDPRKAPKGKIPYISDEGELIGDSHFIIQHLKSKYGDPLSEGLKSEQLATAHALRVMLEERTYWAGMIYPRWVKEDHHKMIADTFFTDIPAFLRMTVFRMIAKGVSKGAKAQGMTNHTDAEIYELGLADVKTVETILGDKNYILGEAPTEIDCTVFAFLYGMASEMFPTPIQAYIKNSSTLSAYVSRMEDTVFKGHS